MRVKECFLLFHSITFSVGVESLSQQCSLKPEDIKAVTIDSVTGEYVWADIEDDDSFTNWRDYYESHFNHDFGGRRNKRNLEGDDKRMESMLLQSGRRVKVALNATDGSDLIFVRSCRCGGESNLFCPVEFDTCEVPVSTGPEVLCFVKSQRKALLRNAWPIMMLWYATMSFFLLCTEKGRNTRYYILQAICKRNINEQIVARFLFLQGYTDNPGTSNDSGEGSLAGGVSEVLPVATRVEPPSELVLRTRTITDDDVDQSSTADDDDENVCTICFSALEVGDRVGVLSCKHVFHVDCLKTWLPRRNVCPLCQDKEAAAPRYEQEAIEAELTQIGDMQEVG